MAKIRVVLVGLGFGRQFVEIYSRHPDVEWVGVYDANPKVIKDVCEKHKIKKVYGSYEEVLQDKEVDAVHLVTPIPMHAEQTIMALNFGKHCACTVPMATTIDDIRRIVEAQRKSGKNFMMMETTLYTYHFLYVKDMIDRGELGKIQFLRGCHYQDMAGWPEYWRGLPPMYYGTHAIAPMTVLSGSAIKRVNCFGSGTMDKSLYEKYKNPYPIECALIDFGNGIKGEATRSLFETARAYREGLFVYGSKKSFEWGFYDGSDPYVTEIAEHLQNDGDLGRQTRTTVVQLPNFHMRLPEQLQRFTVGDNFDPLHPKKSLARGAGGAHHGSHPHLVHEFVRSIIEDRKPFIDVDRSANITAACICAHESAMKDGKEVYVPEF